MTATPQIKAARAAGGEAVGFQSAILHRRLWAKQKQIARAAVESRDTSVKGCHASGKTFSVSGSILHHLAEHREGKVITIAPTLRQVKLMWEEVELARQKSLLKFPECSTTGLRITEERYGIGFSSNHGVNAQGFHGKDVLLLTDESPGIQADVWDAVEGIRAGGRVRLLRLGNPTVPSGPFFDSFSRHRSSTNCITISAFDTPNLQNVATGKPYTIAELEALTQAELEYSPVPYLVSRWWVLDKYRRWGENNPRYVSRVLGEFPSQSDHSVFSLEWIEAAKREPTEHEIERAKQNGSYVQVGIDVAGAGDDETTCTARVNGMIIARGAWADADPRGKVAQWLHALRANSGYPFGVVVVDIDGIGYYFAKHLAEMSFPVLGFNAQRAPQDPSQFVNAKSEAYFRLREMYRDRYVSHAAGTVDEETEAQLSSVQYRETGRGLIQIEPKDEARKRGVSSPDRAESEILAFCRVVLREQRFTLDGEYEISPI